MKLGAGFGDVSQMKGSETFIDGMAAWGTAERSGDGVSQLIPGFVSRAAPILESCFKTSPLGQRNMRA